MEYTRSFKSFFFYLAALFVLVGSSSAFAAGGIYHVEGIDLKGAERTNPEWVSTYLGYTFPADIHDEEIDEIRIKLLTTQVFTDVNVAVAEKDGKKFLEITLTEKWTTVPVVRGAFGGGTPLRVFGVYDTHVFGSLWTLGAETRKYGSAPAGGVVWARAPRYSQGYHVQSYEFWREFRLRRIYDHNDEELGSVRSDFSMLRILLMAPFWGLAPRSYGGIWKYGADARFLVEAPSHYDPADGSPTQDPPVGIHLSDKKTQRLALLARTEYDNVKVQQLNYHGLRLIFAGGPLLTEEETASKTELETFYYYSFLRDFNLCVHVLAGQTTSDSLESQYFLGGFDSIRGIPDGALYGNRAAYSNVELRTLLMRFKYAWLQSALFYDSGGAGQNWSDARDAARASAGAGIRLASPQVYRLMLRVDYAWSLDNPGVSGISIGMNQFFEPYKPL